jgi:hypothetical protein
MIKKPERISIEGSQRPTEEAAEMEIEIKPLINLIGFYLSLM